MAQDFFSEHFITPIINNGWYTPINTIVYGILLIIGVYVVFRLLKRLNVNIDRKFLYAILPFIFWGSSTRVLHDAAFSGALATPALNEFYSSALFPTPGSYLITFALALGVILCSLLVQKFSKIPYWKPMAITGVILCAINVFLIPFKELTPFVMIVGFWIIASAIFIIPTRIKTLTKKVKSLRIVLSDINLVILSAHLLDASATFVSLQYFGYWEQHVVPNIFIPMFGPVVMFFLKAIVVIPVLWLIDRYGEKGNFNNFLKIVILILGLAPGLRDLLRLVAMV